MRVFYTPDLTKEVMGELTRDYAEFIYCGLDSMVTHEVKNVQDTQGNEFTDLVYKFERAMQKPALTMMTRGISVNPVLRHKMMQQCAKDAATLESYINSLANRIWDKPLNSRSPAQLKEILYESMQFPRQYTWDKGAKRLTTNREALEKLQDEFLYARPLVGAILSLRDIERKVSVLRNTIDSSGRFRASYNIAGTETGRWSSSKNVFGGGSNAQNITEELREIFIPDPSFKLGYIDLQQAESYCVAYLSGDSGYLAACLSGDLHTAVARMVWPFLEWSAERNLRYDREIADKLFYRHFTYRDMSKRGGHAYNYYGKPPTIARHLKIPVGIAEDFRRLYLEEAFPGISRWHLSVKENLQRDAKIITPIGRTRLFFDRLDDDATLRQAIAHEPQSIVADVLNIGLYRLWKYMDEPGRFEILGQVHDAAIFQYRETEPELVEQASELLKVKVPIKGRIMCIPNDVKVGYDWKNLKKFGSDEERAQKRLYIPQDQPYGILDNPI